MRKFIFVFLIFIISCTLIFVIFDRSNTKKIIKSIEYDNFELFEELIQHTNLDENPYLLDLDRVNVSPLHFACKNGKYEYVVKLVKAGADLNNTKNSLKMSPLIITLATSPNENRFRIARYLIECGAEINIEAYGDTAINYVFRKNSIYAQDEYEFALYMIENGALVDRGSLGHLIYDAAKMNNKLMVEYFIINEKVDINSVDQYYGNSILMWALMFESFDVANFLLDNNVDINFVNDMGKTAMDIALESNNVEIINRLKKLNN